MIKEEIPRAVVVFEHAPADREGSGAASFQDEKQPSAFRIAQEDANIDVSDS